MICLPEILLQPLKSLQHSFENGAVLGVSGRLISSNHLARRPTTDGLLIIPD
jgi:hypothetical protein